MARAIWTGVISFGLVAVPVRMFSATREHEVSFHQFEKGTSDRIRYQRVNERTGKEVDYADIVKGADIGGGDHVLLEAADLDAVAPGRSRSMEIHQFVDLDEIDPIYFQKTYYLAPGSEETVKTYMLLRDAMADLNRAAVATLVMRNKEYLAAVRADGNLLVLETMYFADEVRDPKEVLDSVPRRTSARPQEVRMASQLIDSMTGPWRPADYRDTYTDRVNDLIDAKKAGAEITPAEDAPEATNVIDLMDVLRRSVEAARQRRGKGGRKDSESRRPARRSASAAPATKDASPRTPRGTGRATLAEMTKADLSVLARKLDIPGRSAMSRDELESALSKARGQRRQAS
ncbi:DNA end-binding protein Ku [Allocatelliglobosispora scoriae]|uniref:Non-homologous end joining protein Ku n=1 Tax=Allocatelliglobosispora scoriae TaxID=643052 RepID=A0A841BJP1_9ACTN|nr:Ku protein [Allocatelliglobosispora scoriae]MBB5867855.1 DNA end-binding protein Ku [Allocatelliglobosispora scoriae]